MGELRPGAVRSVRSMRACGALLLLSLTVLTASVLGVAPGGEAHSLASQQQNAPAQPVPTGAVPTSGSCTDSGSGSDAGNLCVKLSGAKLTKIK